MDPYLEQEAAWPAARARSGCDDRLASLVSRVYDLGRYARTLRRDQPLPEATPLTPEDRAWVEGIGRLAEPEVP